jgi:thiol:disulfide interchange protein
MRLLISIFLFVFLLSGVGFASSSKVIIETKTLQPGQSLWIGVLLKHDRGWHSYYKNPGDSGMPTKIKWQLPQGFRVGEIQWPAPTKISVSGIVNYGYENQVLLLSRLQVPKNLIPGQKVTLTAQVNFLVCKEECVPAKAVISQTIYIEETLPQNQFQKLISDTLTEIALEKQGVIHAEVSPVHLGWILLAAFVGGMILNLMPCVFPVLAIKVLGFLQHGHKGIAHARLHGIIYALGIMVSFWVLAGILLVLKATGLELGWGFQLQSPLFVLALGILFVALAMNMWGFFEINFSFGAKTKKIQNPYLATFFQGVLAVVVATPCTAPFMGVALGYALTADIFSSLVVFTAMALGLSFPYLLLSFYPKLIQKLPRPGNWMVILKKVLAIPLFLTAIWLITIFFSLIQPQIIYQKVNAKTVWEVYSPAREQQLLKTKQPFFIDFTASWCLTCQVNKKLVLEKQNVLQKFKEKNYVLLRADWTNQNEMIARALRRYDRSGVPVYVIYSGQGSPTILSEILTIPYLLRSIR